jgi:predicted AAA+ superfamily ATPase
LTHFGCDQSVVAAAHDEALRWALERGSRSGRVAWQFARDWAGRHSIQK